MQKKTFTKWVNKHLIKVWACAASRTPRPARRESWGGCTGCAGGVARPLAPERPHPGAHSASLAEHRRTARAGAPAASAVVGQRLRPLGCFWGGLLRAAVGLGRCRGPLPALPPHFPCPAVPGGCAVLWPCWALGQAGSCQPPLPHTLASTVPAPGGDGALAPGTRGPFAGFDAAEPGSSAGFPARAPSAPAPPRLPLGTGVLHPSCLPWGSCAHRAALPALGSACPRPPVLSCPPISGGAPLLPRAAHAARPAEPRRGLASVPVPVRAARRAEPHVSTWHAPRRLPGPRARTCPRTPGAQPRGISAAASVPARGAAAWGRSRPPLARAGAVSSLLPLLTSLSSLCLSPRSTGEQR